MNKEIIKPIAVAAFIGTVLIGSLTFYDFYMTKVQGAAIMENRRISLEKDDIIKVKCIEPKAEFAAKETAYLKDYGLLFNPTSKYDVLDIKDGKESQQYNDASMLKMDDELATQGCEEAKQEVAAMKDTDRWTYFQSNWKRMMFGDKA
ncbi:hypothetical protein [Variovorax sp. RA8]|uniref:hypothetical protein n=1 Tax=Variovorax sp. (strain JCM 16519 / RA8) TaxID=662548 RepID=UPI0013170D94|nr:hypothetical protein [Variovorax sp. RA8]VTU34452.1 hypothetical protein RA8CHR_04976 [Variovorax sp. RA8]